MGVGMSKDLSVRYEFAVASDEQFHKLADAFAHALKAVENQGYSVEYAGEILNHPGQIGVIGRPGSGKSTFFDAVMDSFISSISSDAAKVEVKQKTQPSYDRSRDVQVWKRWLLDGKDGKKEVRIVDAQASSALSHLPGVMLDQMESAGISIHEHPDNPEEYCDLVMRFNYDGEGVRTIELKATQSVAKDDEFANSFLPNVQDLIV